MSASKSILLRVTPDEHAALSSLSQETGLSLSRLVVSRVLGGAGSPASEVARARAALQAALKALDGEEAPVVEAPVTTPVIEPPVVEEVIFEIPKPPGFGLAGPKRVEVLRRVRSPDANRSHGSWTRAVVAGVTEYSECRCRPGAILLAHGRDTRLIVGRAVDKAVVWGEVLSTRADQLGATLDRLQALATRDLCPSAWEDGEEDDVLPPVPASEPEVVFVSAPGPGDLDGRDLIRWVKAVGSVDQNGQTGHAIHPPAGLPDFLRDEAEARLRPGTLVVAQAQQKNGRWPVLVYGRTVSDQRHVQWNTDELLDWDGAKISTLIRLRELLAEVV